MFKKLGKLDGWAVVLEGRLEVEGESKQVDLLCRGPRGELVTIEVANTPSHEVHNARFCLRNLEVVRHVIVAVNSASMTGVKKLMERFTDLDGDKRLVLMMVSQALRKGWTPLERLEKGAGNPQKDLFA